MELLLFLIGIACFLFVFVVKIVTDLMANKSKSSEEIVTIYSQWIEKTDPETSIEVTWVSPENDEICYRFTQLPGGLQPSPKSYRGTVQALKHMYRQYK